jgi:hypothetical protein
VAEGGVEIEHESAIDRSAARLERRAGLVGAGEPSLSLTFSALRDERAIEAVRSYADVSVTVELD